MKEYQYWIGLDVGSTTVKIVVIEPWGRDIIYSDYRRHNAEQSTAASALLMDAHAQVGTDCALAVCGSGGSRIAETLEAFFVQEVVANSIAVSRFFPQTRVAIELGGQDAKVIFFRHDERSGELVASDMRMNGSCAGGTGAFVDQVAELLGVRTEEFNQLAAAGTHVYDISGRCGVFAKTDIQPLLNQGVSREDIALSTFHALAKQTIGGLAQGMEITPPVLFEGGPLTFNPRLVGVFAERLGLDDEQTIIPERPETMVAHGAALSIGALFEERESHYDGRTAPLRLKRRGEQLTGDDVTALSPSDNLFFSNRQERDAFTTRHTPEPFHPVEYPAGSQVRAWMGIDAGSTTTKFVLLDEDERVINTFYASNRGEPLDVIRGALADLRDAYRDSEVDLEILGVGTTGYGEKLFAEAFHADYHTVETVAHATAAQKIAPGVSFILDIGGQDMKAIFLNDGIVTGIVLNEACSAGCGSFLETYARSLGVPIQEVGRLAFEAESPSRLGSRCTVFMNSSIITEQKNGKSTEDILGGVCRSIIENVFTKVVRIANVDALGGHIVVQGGTFANDAVLRAFEQYAGCEVVRPQLPGHMGAIGIALLTKHQMEQETVHAREQGLIGETERIASRFIGLGAVDNFSYQKKPGVVCRFCSNNCMRTIIEFGDGGRFITGNRCERGEVVGDATDPETRKLAAAVAKKNLDVPDMIRLHNELLTRSFLPEGLQPIAPRKTSAQAIDGNSSRRQRIGIPRVLEFWQSMPYWNALFASLGFEVVISRPSSYALFEEGLSGIPSDTICFPAKLAHGHVSDLVKKKVDRIFMPMMIRMPREAKGAASGAVCPVIQGYPMIVAESDEPARRFGVRMDYPVFHWYDVKRRRTQTRMYLESAFGIGGRAAARAVRLAEHSLAAFRTRMADEGRRILADLHGSNRFAVLIAGRPYHADTLVNHNMSRCFTQLGIPVLTLEGISDLHNHDLRESRMESYVPLHTRMVNAAMSAAEHPNIELAQIVSFGCGHDAVITDEMARVLRERSGKQLLSLKLDEGEATGPMMIRVRSFIETVRAEREKRAAERDAAIGPAVRPLPKAFPVAYQKSDRTARRVIAPNLSPGFSRVMATALAREGIEAVFPDMADDRAFALGKRFVHNDICFPAQVNIGEILAWLETHPDEAGSVSAGLAKNCDACRAGQYAGLARKALDDAGYDQVPIVTTGDDPKGLHPGFQASPLFQIRSLWGLAMLDGLDMMRHRLRPYELVAGSVDRTFETSLTDLCDGLRKNHRAGLRALERAVAAFHAVPVDTTVRKPRVGITGEILMKYHPTANGNVVRYLEENGMEAVVPGMVDFFRRQNIIDRELGERNLAPAPFLKTILAGVAEKTYEHVERAVGAVMQRFSHYESHGNVHDLVPYVDGIIDRTFISGEGWLIPAEIMHMAHHGVGAFVILNPFGCLPNHISGRGMVKVIKKRYPDIHVISLDYDPDTSFANIENRLQMLVMATRETHRRAGATAGQSVERA
ncbi:MAG: CoA activase [Spirochaetaceae bacterium]|nr:MAG: CoA activase [Spirochaetaceae bacterium]